MPGRAPNASRTKRALAVVLTAVALLCPGAAVAQGLSLEDAVRKALENDERPEILRARVESARARIAVARTRLMPDVSLGADYMRREASAGGAGPDEIVATAGFGVPIFDPSAAPLIRRARLLTEGAELDLRDERRLIVLEVATAFLLALSSEQVVQAAERRMEYAGQALGDAQARADAGLASINDVTKVELERSTAARDATRARADLQAAYLTLAFLIGEDVAGPLVPPEPLLASASLPPPEPEALIARARAERLDLRSRRKAAESWDAFADEPLRRFLPSFGIVGAGEIAALRDDSVDDVTGARRKADDSDWSIGLGLSWPLFDAGLRAAERRERRALAEESTLLADVLERRLATEVRSARVEMVSSQQAVRDAAIALDAARRNAQETFELYRQGLRAALDVADAGNRAFDADVSLTRERLALALAWVDLLVAVGSDPLSPEPLP